MLPLSITFDNFLSSSPSAVAFFTNVTNSLSTSSYDDIFVSFNVITSFACLSFVMSVISVPSIVYNLYVPCKSSTGASGKFSTSIVITLLLCIPFFVPFTLIIYFPFAVNLKLTSALLSPIGVSLLSVISFPPALNTCIESTLSSFFLLVTVIVANSFSIIVLPLFTSSSDIFSPAPL